MWELLVLKHYEVFELWSASQILIQLHSRISFSGYIMKWKKLGIKNSHKIDYFLSWEQACNGLYLLAM